MVADYFTKPFHGSLFENLRNIIMGVTHSLLLTTPPPVNECFKKIILLNVEINKVRKHIPMPSGGRGNVIINMSMNPTYDDVVKSGYGKITRDYISLALFINPVVNI